MSRTAPLLVSLCVLASSPARAGGPCDCLGDLDVDGAVGATDLALLLGGWGGAGAADIDGNGAVDASDLAILLGAWGPCAPPDNDHCVAAENISSAATEIWVPFCTAAATTGPASLPTPTCGLGVSIGKDVWFRRQVGNAGKVRIDLCDAGFDTVLAVYRQPNLPDRCLCPPNAAVAVVACNDDSDDCGLQSAVEFDVGELDCLTIRVGGYTFGNGTVAAGAGVLHLKEIHRGDRCDVAHQLPSQEVVTVVGHTLWDTWLDADPTSCATNDTKDEWYRYTMPCDGTLTISTCAPGTSFDTTLAVFTACGGSELACNDDSTDAGCDLGGLSLKSKVSLVATSGETLLIRVSGWNGAEGNFELSLVASCVR